MYEKDLIYQIALTRVEGIGHITAKTLFSYCGGAEAVFTERKKILEKIPGIGSQIAANIGAYRDFEWAEKELLYAAENNIRVIGFGDAFYPRRLKLVPDSPFVLYFKGKGSPDHGRVVAVVGTRRSTPYGKAFTEKLIADLAPYDCLVVSGLAYGIDIAAHRAAMQNDTPTVAVLAHGLNTVYPYQHRAAAKKMQEKGGLLCEYLSGTLPEKQHFPERNRIVAGLCDVCVVVETAVKGGAMITAELANAHNRDVMALPGRVNDPFSAGCNRLVKTNKAHLIESASDLVYLMGWEQEQASAPAQRRLFADVTDTEKMLLDLLPNPGSISVDDLFLSSHLPMSQLSLLLLDLEIKGLVRSLPGKAYELVN